MASHDVCICAECEDRRRDAKRYPRLKRIHQLSSNRYVLFAYSAMALSSEEFDRALDGLPEPGERRDS